MTPSQLVSPSATRELGRSAWRAGCTTLYTEDLRDGWLIDDRLRVVNPFVKPAEARSTGRG